MFNVTGGEIVIVLLLALIVLGPDKLPEFIRGAGRMYGEIKKMTSGFTTEFRESIDEPMREMRETANMAKSWFEEGLSESDTSDEVLADDDDESDDEADADDDDESDDEADAESDDEADDEADDDPNFYDDDGVLIDAEAMSRMNSDGTENGLDEAASLPDEPGKAQE